MNPIVLKIIKTLIGKNSAHIARKVQTWLGGLLLSSALLPWMAAAPIDPALVDTTIEAVTAVELSDGMTVGEVLRLVFGILLIWVSRGMSFLRARNLGWLADWSGLLIGRSISSLWRSALTVTSAFLAWAGMTGGVGAGLTSMPIVDIIAALISIGMVGISSSMQDGKLNAVETSPPNNQLLNNRRSSSPQLR